MRIKIPETLNQEFNGFENLMRAKFEEFLISTPQFKLNNSRNVREDDEDKDLNNKRFQITGGNLIQQIIEQLLHLILKHFHLIMKKYQMKN